MRLFEAELHTTLGKYLAVLTVAAVLTFMSGVLFGSLWGVPGAAPSDSGSDDPDDGDGPAPDRDTQPVSGARVTDETDLRPELILTLPVQRGGAPSFRFVKAGERGRHHAGDGRVPLALTLEVARARTS